jgi:predicted dehydrogenase
MSHRLRAVLVGMGGMGKVWTKVLKENPRTEVVGMVDIRLEAAQKAAQDAGLPAEGAGTDLRAMLAKVKPELVVDCTVPEAHHAVTLAALAAGCHVIGEKPLADSMAHAREMVAAAQTAQRTYMVSQNRRWIPAVRAVRKALAEGLIGHLTTVNADFYLGAHFKGFRNEMAHPLLLDMAIHHFDMMRCMTQTDPQAAYCHAFNPRGSWYRGDVAATALFEMTGGVVFTYRGSWCSEGLNTSWEAEWRFVGDRGTLIWDGRKLVVAEVVVPPADQFTSKVERKEIPVPDTGPAGQAGTLARFLEALDAGQPPEAWCGDNLKSLAMVCGAVASAARKARVTVET